MAGAATLDPGLTYASLTVAGKDALDRVKAALDELEHRNRQAEQARAEVSATVYDALEAGVPAKFLAAEIGLTVSRVYQMRDEVATYRKR